MKKIIVLIMVLILTLTLSSCIPRGSDIINEGDTIIEYNGEPVYTQEEVAEMYNIQQGYIDDLELRIEELETTLDDYFTKEEVRTLLDNVLQDYYTQEELDEGFEDVLISIEELELRIAELE